MGRVLAARLHHAPHSITPSTLHWLAAPTTRLLRARRPYVLDVLLTPYQACIDDATVAMCMFTARAS